MAKNVKKIAGLEYRLIVFVRQQLHFLAALVVLVLVSATTGVSPATAEEGVSTYFSTTYREARLKRAVQAPKGAFLRWYR